MTGAPGRLRRFWQLRLTRDALTRTCLTRPDWELAPQRSAERSTRWRRHRWEEHFVQKTRFFFSFAHPFRSRLFFFPLSLFFRPLENSPLRWTAPPPAVATCRNACDGASCRGPWREERPVRDDDARGRRRPGERPAPSPRAPGAAAAHCPPADAVDGRRGRRRGDLRPRVPDAPLYRCRDLDGAAGAAAAAAAEAAPPPQEELRLLVCPGRPGPRPRRRVRRAEAAAVCVDGLRAVPEGREAPRRQGGRRLARAARRRHGRGRGELVVVFCDGCCCSCCGGGRGGSGRRRDADDGSRSKSSSSRDRQQRRRRRLRGRPHQRRRGLPRLSGGHHEGVLARVEGDAAGREGTVGVDSER